MFPVDTSRLALPSRLVLDPGDGCTTEVLRGLADQLRLRWTWKKVSVAPEERCPVQLRISPVAGDLWLACGDQHQIQKRGAAFLPMRDRELLAAQLRAALAGGAPVPPFRCAHLDFHTDVQVVRVPESAEDKESAPPAMFLVTARVWCTGCAGELRQPMRTDLVSMMMIDTPGAPRVAAPVLRELLAGVRDMLQGRDPPPPDELRPQVQRFLQGRDPLLSDEAAALLAVVVVDHLADLG